MSEQYYVRFWWKNPETGFIEKREEYFGAKGTNSHKYVKGQCCKKFNIKHADIIFVGYC